MTTDPYVIELHLVADPPPRDYLSDVELVLMALRQVAGGDGNLEMSERLRADDLADLIVRAIDGDNDGAWVEARLQAEPIGGVRDVPRWPLTGYDSSAVIVGETVRVKPTKRGGRDGYRGRVKRILADTDTHTVTVEVVSLPANEGGSDKARNNGARTYPFDRIERIPGRGARRG